MDLGELVGTIGIVCLSAGATVVAQNVKEQLDKNTELSETKKRVIVGVTAVTIVTAGIGATIGLADLILKCANSPQSA